MMPGFSRFTSFRCNSEVGKNPAGNVVQFNSFQSRNIWFSFSNQNFSKIFFKNNVPAAVNVYYSYQNAVNSMYRRKDTPSNFTCHSSETSFFKWSGVGFICLHML